MDILNKDQLLALEEKCIQEEPPAAMAACPLRVECRTISMAVKDGHFDAARASFTKLVPLPHSLSHLCRMPCTEACLRKDLGGAIRMRELEWAAMTYGKARPAPLRPRRKIGRAAVIGSGPFGLTAASELSKKGFQVTLFEKEGTAGGGLLKSGLPKEALEEDLKLVKGTGVEFRFNEEIKDPKELLNEFKAVVVADGRLLEGADPATLLTPEEGIFSGGPFTSLVEAIAAGKRAANSADRWVKKVSVTAGREMEMDRTTRLYVETKYFEDEAPVEGRFFSREDAIREAARCLDCQCMECAKACAFIAHYKRYPKLYLREIYNNLSIALGNHTSNTLINACSLCDQCELVCPNGLNLGEAIQSARNIMVETKKIPPSAFEFAVDDMRQANSKKSYFLRHQPGTRTSLYMFFPGCQLGASAPETVKKTYEYLCQTLDGGVAFMQACCGVMAQWAGDSELYQETRTMIREAWESIGRPNVITSCPTCRKTLADLFDDAVTDIWGVLLETGLPEIDRPIPLTIHDACGARDMEETREAVRIILEELGCEVHEPYYTGDQSPCCGYGGLVQFSNADMAQTMTRFAIQDVDETRLTYCMGCRDRFSREGARSIHLLELLFGKADEDRKAPGYSLRQDNREYLRRSMLFELWGIKEKEKDRMRLTYEEDLAELLDQRLILEEDIRQVIEEAVESKCFILEKKTGLHIAHKQIGNVTYWVYFEPEGEGFRVRRAYSHRMEIRG